MKKILQLLVLIPGGLLAAGLLFFLLFPAPQPPPSIPEPAEAAPAGRSSLVLGSSPAGTSQRAGRNEFGFGETIYATAAIEELEPGDRVLTFRWINPRGKVQETFRREFSTSGGSYRGWSWLALRGEELLAFPLGPLGPPVSSAAGGSRSSWTGSS